MAYKSVSFCAGGSSDKVAKNFTTSLIKQRLKSEKKPMKYRFRRLIRNYKSLFKSGADEALENLFKKDLILLISEAVSEVQSNGGTLNRALALTQLVPETRKISNQINLIVRRAGKFYERNGYLNKALQVSFNDLLKELIGEITDVVKSDSLTEEAIDREPELVAASAKKFSANRLTLFGSEDQITEILDSIDLDELNISDITSDKIYLNEDSVPEILSDKFTKFASRCKSFNSEMKCLTVYSTENSVDEVVKKLEESDYVNLKGGKFNYDFSKGESSNRYVVYLDASEFLKSDESNGVYEGDVKPESVKVFDEVVIDEFPEVFELIDEGLSTSNLMKLDRLVKSLDKEKLELSLVNKYGSNPIPNLMK